MAEDIPSEIYRQAEDCAQGGKSCEWHRDRHQFLGELRSQRRSLDSLDRRVTTVESRLDHMDKRLTAIDGRLGLMTDALQSISQSLAVGAVHLDALPELQARVAAVERAAAVQAERLATVCRLTYGAVAAALGLIVHQVVMVAVR